MKGLLQWGMSRTAWLGCSGADDASADGGPKWWEAWDVPEEETGRKRQRHEPADLESAERSAEQLRQLHALPIQALPGSACAMPGRPPGLTSPLSCLPVADVVCEAALTTRPGHGRSGHPGSGWRATACAWLHCMQPGSGCFVM